MFTYTRDTGTLLYFKSLYPYARTSYRYTCGTRANARAVLFGGNRSAITLCRLCPKQTPRFSQTCVRVTHGGGASEHRGGGAYAAEAAEREAAARWPRKEVTGGDRGREVADWPCRWLVDGRVEAEAAEARRCAQPCSKPALREAQ